jgi:hypothetical protein
VIQFRAGAGENLICYFKKRIKNPMNTKVGIAIFRKLKTVGSQRRIPPFCKKLMIIYPKGLEEYIRHLAEKLQLSKFKYNVESWSFLPPDEAKKRFAELKTDTYAQRGGIGNN